MKTDINLSAKTGLKQKTNKLLLASIIIFAFFFSIAVGLMTYSLILKSQATSLIRKTGDLRGQIASHASQKEKLVIVKERIEAIKKIMGARKNIDTNIALVVSYIPENLGIDSIKADDKEVSLRLSSSSLADFDVLLEEKIPVISGDKKSKITKIELSSFTQKGEGYAISLNFSFNLQKNEPGTK